MARHDFRRSSLTAAHTLVECRTLAPGRYQLTGHGGAPQKGDQVICTLRGSQNLDMLLTVDSVRQLINPPGQWNAQASGPDLSNSVILGWSVNCDQCAASQAFEFLAEDSDDLPTRQQKARVRIAELGWRQREQQHLCPACSSVEQ